MILLNFQTFTLVRKKQSTMIAHSDLKCPFIKFSINTTQGWNWQKNQANTEQHPEAEF